MPSDTIPPCWHARPIGGGIVRRAGDRRWHHRNGNWPSVPARPTHGVGGDTTTSPRARRRNQAGAAACAICSGRCGSSTGTPELCANAPHLVKTLPFMILSSPRTVWFRARSPGRWARPVDVRRHGRVAHRSASAVEEPPRSPTCRPCGAVGLHTSSTQPSMTPGCASRWRAPLQRTALWWSIDAE